MEPAARAAGARGAALVARAAPARLARVARVQETDYGGVLRAAAAATEGCYSRLSRSTYVRETPPKPKRPGAFREAPGAEVALGWEKDWRARPEAAGSIAK